MERSGSDLPVLIGQSGPLNGQRWVISQPLTIGREADCDVVIPDRQVSRYHARVIPQEEGVLLEDLGSKNGTFCNGEKILEAEFIQDGAVLQIALVQNFVFLSSDSTIPLEGGLPEMVSEQPVTGRRFRLDSRSHRVLIADKEVLPMLSVPQFRLVQMLYQHPGKIVSRQDLMAAIWDEDEIEGVSEQALDALIRRLRDRLAEIDPTHNYIVTVRGHGVRLDNPPK